MKIHENLNSELRVTDSTAVGGKITVVDEETEEIGFVISKTPDDKLIVHWQDASENANHSELEIVDLDSPKVNLIKVKEIGEVEYARNPFGLFAKKERFYVDFWADGDFHQTTITAKNKSAAIKIAKRGYKDFELDSIEKINPNPSSQTSERLESGKQIEPRHRRFAK
jgi:hypothetical protein